MVRKSGWSTLQPSKKALVTVIGKINPSSSRARGLQIISQYCSGCTAIKSRLYKPSGSHQVVIEQRDREDLMWAGQEHSRSAPKRLLSPCLRTKRVHRSRPEQSSLSATLGPCSPLWCCFGSCEFSGHCHYRGCNLLSVIVPLPPCLFIDVSLNLMSLGVWLPNRNAVDNAVVVLENIQV